LYVLFQRFPLLLLGSWFTVYEEWALLASQHAAKRGQQIAYSYKGLSSAMGQLMLADRTCHFAGAHGALLAEYSDRMPEAWVVPVLAGAVAVVFNLREVADLELRITREQLAQVFLGRIRRWSELAHRNPMLAGVHESITVVVRSDVSETSEALTSALSSFSTEWQGKIGTSSKPVWPLFTTGAHGKNGVLRQILSQPYSLGYIWQADVETSQQPPLLSRALIENDAGAFVAPSASSVQAAMEPFVAAFQEMGESGARMLVRSIVNPKNSSEIGARDAYPMSFLAYLSFDAGSLGCRLLHDVLYLIYWIWTEPSAAQVATRRGLAPLSSNLVKVLLRRWTSPELSCDRRSHPLVKQLTLEFAGKCPIGMQSCI
jgi:ABC-type phosphate transport system substrate-binding protein